MPQDTSFPLSRRALLGTFTGAAIAASCLSLPAEALAKDDGFRFVHITDTHIQPELRATEGVHKAFATIRALPKNERPAFALIGGDLVMDAAAVDPKRAQMVYDLWQSAAADLGIPLYYTVGNHDLYAINGTSKVPADNPEWGKRYWMHRLNLAQRYTRFDHNGWRFFVLDSVQCDPDGNWWGELDAEQVRWLDDELRQADARMPLVFLTHMPLMTVFGQYTEGTTAALNDKTVVRNGKQFQEMIAHHNAVAVFQGHTHVVEECRYLNTRYITGGAVCGDWWKGPRLGVHPEGFTLVTVRGGDLTYRYIPYGWQAAVEKT